MKGMKKNDMGVSPVIAVILMVAITVVLAGVLYLWVSSLADTEGDVETINVKCELVNGVAADTMTFEVMSGDIAWADYYVKIDGTTQTAETPAAGTSSAGDVASFSWDLTGDDPFATGTTYNIKIVNIENNAVVYDKDIIAKAG